MQHPHLSLLLLSTLLMAANARADSLQQNYLACQKIQPDVQRLRCYDGLVDSIAPADSAADPLQEFDIEALAASDPGREHRIDALDNLVTRQRRGMLQADEPNYFAYTTPVDDQLGDEDHAQFYLSIKYPLAERTFNQWQDKLKTRETIWGPTLNAMVPDRLNFHYNGLFDFYVFDSDRYDSSPVISRRQNPGLSVEYDFAHGRDVLRLGWFHESNGQRIGPSESTQFELLRARHGDDFALARVSRGWDYALLRWHASSQPFIDYLHDQWLTYEIETRFFCDCQGFGLYSGREDDIWWQANNHDSIGDYDGLRAKLEGSLWQSRHDDLAVDARLELKSGLLHSFGDHISGRLSFGVRVKKLRTTLFYFDGYGRDVSTYHLRTRYAGIGLELR